jgi:prolipoprotein diacylglyceryltransferase
MQNCSGNFCHELAYGVYPTSFYEVVICTLLFIFMWLIRKHIYAAGLMFYIYLTTSGLERILIESIRVNEKYRFLGINFSQAEWISLAMLIGGTTGLIYLICQKIITNNNKLTKAI